jgi:predicted nucleic acid-binding protein
VDSSGWVEYLGGGPKSSNFLPYLSDERNLLVPTVVLYEVFKKLFREQGKTIADVFLSHALRSIVISFTEDLALDAAQLSIAHKLAMADAIIYATALSRGAKLVTSDQHFRGLKDAIVF